MVKLQTPAFYGGPTYGVNYLNQMHLLSGMMNDTINIWENIPLHMYLDTSGTFIVKI